MRAATIIVGAIAAASILIALSFVGSGGGSGQIVVTKRVIETVEAPAPAGAGRAGREGGVAQFGGPTECGTELSVENTSCEVGEAVHTEYEGGHRGDFLPKDPATGKIVEFVCEDASEPITCTSEEGAAVYFGK